MAFGGFEQSSHACNLIYCVHSLAYIPHLRRSIRKELFVCLSLRTWCRTMTPRSSSMQLVPQAVVSRLGIKWTATRSACYRIVMGHQFCVQRHLVCVVWSSMPYVRFCRTACSSDAVSEGGQRVFCTAPERGSYALYKVRRDCSWLNRPSCAA